MFLPWYGCRTWVGKTRRIHERNLDAFEVVLLRGGRHPPRRAGRDRDAVRPRGGPRFHLPGGDGTVVMIAGGWTALADLLPPLRQARPRHTANRHRGRPVGHLPRPRGAPAARSTPARRMRAAAQPRGTAPATGDAPEPGRRSRAGQRARRPRPASGARERTGPRRSRPPRSPPRARPPGAVPFDARGAAHADAWRRPPGVRAGPRAARRRPRSRPPPEEQLSLEDPPPRPALGGGRLSLR